MPASAESGPGRTFGRVAEAYARTRPPYPREAIDRAADELSLGDGSTVLDLGAGTGNLTRALRARFARVVAVEPDEAMRAQADGDVLAGSAEEIPLRDGSVDAVFAGEAWHWFDFDRAYAETRRVARRGVAVLMRSWGETEQPGLLPPPFWAELDAVWSRFHVEGRDRWPDWRERLGVDGTATFVQTVPISGRDLVDLHLTASTPASIPEAERNAIAGRAYPLMDESYELRVVTFLGWKRFR